MNDTSDFEDLEVTIKIDVDDIYMYIDFVPTGPLNHPNNNTYINNISSLTHLSTEVGGDYDCEHLDDDN
jgi:hypothetical protein